MSSLIRRLQGRDSCLRLVQITDTHLGREPGDTLLELDTDFSLRCVIDLVKQEHPELDAVLATGDISDNGSVDAYQRAAGYFGEIPAETFWLPGNHDRADTMSQVLGGPQGLVKGLVSEHWQIVLLNSQVPGEVGGQLGAEELDWLKASLDQAALDGLYTLVCLHHQPRPMGSEWIDLQMVEDAEAFWQLLALYPEVRGVLWGHVHQQLDTEYQGMRLMATPSSCVQFAPSQPGFQVDDLPPGYRWLNLHADGSIETGVGRVMGVDFPVDLQSKGYDD